MNELIIKVCPNANDAENVRGHLKRVSDEKGYDFAESVAVVIDDNGKVYFHHSQHFTFPGALSGGFVGFLAGLIIINPILAIFGGILGAAAGAAVGATEDIGLDESFMRRLAEELKPGKSALFLVSEVGDTPKILHELEKFDGVWLTAPLAHQDEKKLKRVLKDLER